VQTTRLHESFEGLNSSLAQASGELSPVAQAAGGRLMLFLQFLDFCAQPVFWAITLVPDRLKRQSRALKTRMIV